MKSIKEAWRDYHAGKIDEAELRQIIKTNEKQKPKEPVEQKPKD